MTTCKPFEVQELNSLRKCSAADRLKNESCRIDEEKVLYYLTELDIVTRWLAIPMYMETR